MDIAVEAETEKEKGKETETQTDMEVEKEIGVEVARGVAIVPAPNLLAEEADGVARGKGTSAAEEGDPAARFTR